MCILCHKSICVVCAEPCRESDDGYDEDLHRVAKCSDCHGQSDLKQTSIEVLRTSSGKSKISDYFLMRCNEITAITSILAYQIKILLLISNCMF